MPGRTLETLCAQIGALPLQRPVGRIRQARQGLLLVEGLSQHAALGDHVLLMRDKGELRGEIVDISDDTVSVLPDGKGDGVKIDDPVMLVGSPEIFPSEAWVGRIIDPSGRPLDGSPLADGLEARPLQTSPPPAAIRKPLGNRISTGMAVFDTVLPLVRGQRLGVFAGSGVGKSHLLAQLARGIDADVIVIALVGERGREVSEFVKKTLGSAGMRRSVVVVATSDQPPITRRQAVWTAMGAAEFFRDQGKHVLMLVDSVTRFAEAHREIALATGEQPSLRGFPPSTPHLIMSMAERAGPGMSATTGDITAVFTVLVAGSDMEEPVADILRGVLDGHIVLDRSIAERGRYPAINLLKSVSRSLPDAATESENTLIGRARKCLSVYEQSEIMIQSGLYVAGSDPNIDSAIKIWPKLDAFLTESSSGGPKQAFVRLEDLLK